MPEEKNSEKVFLFSSFLLAGAARDYCWGSVRGRPCLAMTRFAATDNEHLDNNDDK